MYLTSMSALCEIIKMGWVGGGGPGGGGEGPLEQSFLSSGVWPKHGIRRTLFSFL